MKEQSISTTTNLDSDISDEVESLSWFPSLPTNKELVKLAKKVGVYMANKKCKKCDVELVPSKALQNTWVGHIDFPGDEAFAVGSTITQSGPPVMTSCLKCPECGYSIGNAVEIPKPQTHNVDDFDNHRVDM